MPINTLSKNSHCSSLNRGLALLAFLAAAVAPAVHCFSPQPSILGSGVRTSVPLQRHHLSKQRTPSNGQSKLITNSVSSPSSLSMSLEEINTFYATYPLQAAVLTCGVKASLADFVAQVRSFSDSEQAIEMKRNAAYIIYGGIFIGLMCHVEYDVIFPQLFGTSHNFQTIASKVLFDNFISAPLMWLPPAYFIKAILFGYPLQEGADRYVTDIKEGLLIKYWSLWLPAQVISFTFVPDQLRVLFMACISFGWFIVLSSVQSETDSAAEAVLEDQDETVMIKSSG